MWIDHILFIRLSIDRHLGCFHFLVVMNNTTVNIHVQVFVSTCVFTSLGQISRNGFAQLYDKSVSNILRNCQTPSQRNCTVLYSQSTQQGIKGWISSHPCQHFLLSFFNIAILVRIEWYFIMFLICISLMAGDIEHLFMCFEAMCISSLEKGLFRSFVHLFVFLLLSYMCSLYILDTRPLSNTICKIFLPFLGENFFYFPFLDQDFGLFFKKMYLFIYLDTLSLS